MYVLTLTPTLALTVNLPEDPGTHRQGGVQAVALLRERLHLHVALLLIPCQLLSQALDLRVALRQQLPGGRRVLGLPLCCLEKYGFLMGNKAGMSALQASEPASMSTEKRQSLQCQCKRG